jgi:hypothetical protein
LAFQNGKMEMKELPQNETDDVTDDAAESFSEGISSKQAYEQLIEGVRQAVCLKDLLLLLASPTIHLQVMNVVFRQVDQHRPDGRPWAIIQRHMVQPLWRGELGAQVGCGWDTVLALVVGVLLIVSGGIEYGVCMGSNGWLALNRPARR